MAKRRISKEDGLRAIESSDQATAVRYLLQLLEESNPGGTVELRVPPFGAVQLFGGLEHRRGTPPNVVEISPELFLSLAVGEKLFSEHLNTKELSLSGSRAIETQRLFPIAYL